MPNLTGPQRITLHPWQTKADLRRAKYALRGLRDALSATAVDPVALAGAWDALRVSFGTPGRGPEGVSVDSVGLPDVDGFSELLNRSTELPRRDKDMVAKLPATLKALRQAMVRARDGNHGGRREALRKATAEARELVHTIVKRFVVLTRDTVPEVATGQVPTPAMSEADRQPLTPRQQKIKSFLSKLPKGQARNGVQIVAELKRQGIRITEATFRRHDVPNLAVHGMVNEPSRGGYYFPAKAARKGAQRA